MLERLKVFRLGSALLMAATLALVGCSNSGDDLAPAPAPVPVPVPVPGVTYTVGGTVSGLTGTGLVLQNNNASDLAVAANGAFTFATPVAVGASYSVTVKTQPSGQTCSVGNGSGTSTGANVTNVTVTCSTNTYTVGGTASGLIRLGLVLQNNNASDLAVAANGAFTFATPVAAGASYSVTVKTQPSGQTCSVGNGSGTSAGANVTNVTVTCSISKQFAYVVNSASNNVSAYTINATTGELTAIGSPVAAGTNPFSIAIDPTGKFAYVANASSNNVSAYTVNATTGELTAIGSPVPAGTNPYSIAIDPTGKFAYVANLIPTTFPPIPSMPPRVH